MNASKNEMCFVAMISAHFLRPVYSSATPVCGLPIMARDITVTRTRYDIRYDDDLGHAVLSIAFCRRDHLTLGNFLKFLGFRRTFYGPLPSASGEGGLTVLSHPDPTVCKSRTTILVLTILLIFGGMTLYLCAVLDQHSPRSGHRNKVCRSSFFFVEMSFWFVF